MTGKVPMAVSLTVFVLVNEDITEDDMDAEAEAIRASVAADLECRDVQLGASWLAG